MLLVSDVLFVVCTQSNERQFKDTPTGISFDMLERAHGIKLDTKIFYENRRGLSTCYNEAITECTCEYIVFIHDDVYINDMFIFDKLGSAFEFGHVVGLAGATSVQLQDGANAWWCTDNTNQSGMVGHTISDNGDDVSRSAFKTYGPSMRTCVVMDGVFLGVNVSTIKTKGVLFDEQFTFDGYDFDFCLTARTKGLTLLTWPIAITHCSHGAGAGTAKFIEVGRKLFNKWRHSTKKH